MREEDLEHLYLRLERPLYNVVFRWVWNQDDAREIVQEAFVRLWRMRDRVRMESIEPLTYRIALNLAASRARSARIWRWVSLDAVRDARSAGRLADESLVEREGHARLRAAVGALPKHLRAVLTLCECSDLTYDQIGQVLSIPAGTVASRRNRALSRLRRTLSTDESANRGRQQRKTV